MSIQTTFTGQQIYTCTHCMYEGVDYVPYKIEEVVMIDLTIPEPESQAYPKCACMLNP